MSESSKHSESTRPADAGGKAERSELFIERNGFTHL